MGVPYNGAEMTAHPQYLTVRNGRGREMLDAVAGRLTLLPTQSSGARGAFVAQTVISDDECGPPARVGCTLPVRECPDQEASWCIRNQRACCAQGSGHAQFHGSPTL